MGIIDGLKGAARGMERARSARTVREANEVPEGHLYCTQCGTQGKPERSTPGSLLIEIVLWLCFLIPGIIYSLWRLNRRHDVCPACGSTSLIPPNTPRALAMKEGRSP